MRRPVFFCTVIYAWGQAAAYYSAERSSFVLFAFWLASAVLIGLMLDRQRAGSGNSGIRQAVRRSRAVPAAALVLVFFLAGAAVMTIRTAQLDPGSEADFPARGRFTVRVISVGHSGSGTYMDCEQAGSGSERMRVFIRERTDASNGQDDTLTALIGRSVEIRAELEIPASAGNPRTFDYRRYLKGRGICLTGKLLSDPGPGDVKEKGPGIFAVRRWIANGRDSFLSRIGNKEDRAFAAGILFGDTSGMDEDELGEFRENGTAHILAVSGLHIGALATVLARLRNRTGKKWTVVPCALFLLIYGEASCWSPSVSRAVMLAVVRMAGDVSDRPFDSTETAAAVSFCILSARPYMLFDQGFQMSFLALLSIKFLLPYLRQRLGAGLSVMLAVQTVMIPYSALTYGLFSPLSTVMNVPMIFLASIYAPLGAGAFIAELAAGTSGPAPAVLAGMGRLMKCVNHILFLGNRCIFRVVSPPLWAVVLFLSAVFLLASEWGEVFLRERKSRGTRAVFAAAVITAVLSAWIVGRSPFDRADSVFLDVGQGDSLHVRCGRDTDILIDGGGSAYGNVGEKTLMPYLYRNGVWDIDLALATHLHTDHYLGIVQLAEAYRVRQVVTEGIAGDEILIDGSTRIKILWPTPENAGSEDENFGSLVFMVEQKGIRTLITGDLTAEGERALLEMYAGTDELRCHILKVAHHGSRFSSTDEFLDAAKPMIALIGVGKNEYGHPSPSVIEKLEAKGIMVFRTDLDGAVGIRVMEDRIRVCTGRSMRTEDFLTTWRTEG